LAKIAVNTRLLLKDKLEGIGWFSYETLQRITRQHPEHEFLFIFDRRFDEEFIFNRNITPVVIGPQARHPVLYYFWFEYAVPRLLYKHKPDMFLSPDGYLSLATSTPSLPVIHDINFVHYPESVPYLTGKYYNYFFPHYAQKARRIATVSEYSKYDICKNFNVPDTKIDVVYNGANKIFKPFTEEEKEQCRQQYTAGEEFFLYVGSLHPRKNIERLILAFEAYKQVSAKKTKLLIVGDKMFKTNEIKKIYKNCKYRSDIIFAGRKSADELRNIYGAALSLVFVSYFEGFGIPLLEAMNCGVPVITSNVTSLPEIAGEAAVKVNPFSVNEIKEAMLLIAGDEKRRNDLIIKGHEQAKKFSWDKTADKLWESIEKALEQ